MTQRDPRILLVRLSHLGDVVHALGVFHALRGRYPGAEIAWAVQNEFASLLDGLPGLARVIRFDRAGGLGAWNTLWRELREFGAEWAVDAQGNAKSAAVVLASLAGRRTGLAREDWQEPLAAGVINDPAPRSQGLHAMERMRALAGHVAPAVELRLDAALTEPELATGRAWLAQAFPGRAGPLRLIHLARGGDPRSWPRAHAARWIGLELARGADVLAISGPAEAGELAELELCLGQQLRFRHWHGRDDLRALAAVLAAAAEREARMLACDSGPMHLAVACGVELVCLAGPQDERRTGPWRGRSLRAAQSPECAPCRERSCAHPEGAVCMRRIEPEDALAALEADDAS